MMHASEKERELRLHLFEAEDFARVLASAPAPAGGEQPLLLINHYFDTSERTLGAERVVLRAREEEAVTLTLKWGRETLPGFFESQELHQKLERSDLDRLQRRPAAVYEFGGAPAQALEERFGRVKLEYLGALRNRRQLRVGPHEWTLELDRMTFPDGTERYELELETDTDATTARDAIESWLHARGIRRFAPERSTKTEHFVEWLTRSQRG